ncbi:MAG: endo,4-beta-xylanase [Thermoleophilaceae bacterium]|jgi:endo-1,4-beta-xylanase|nr:endo,4-beta-xylanase [Thermoleophilaceae bacterium]
MAAATVVGCDDSGSLPGGFPVAPEPVSPDAYLKPLGAAVEPQHAREDPAYRERLITQFTSVTPENAMKWAVIQPEQGRFDFHAADDVVSFASETGKRVRGHALVWDEQLPPWLADRAWEPDELRAVLEGHIHAVAGHYQGRIAEWDVVNEPLTADGQWEQNLWYRTLGPEYVAVAFRAAQQADPGARLFLNEIGAEYGPKSDALLRLAGELKRDGVPIDGVGFQHHTTGAAAPDSAQLRALFAATRRLGLAAAITELDVPYTEPGLQARVYGRVARACATAPNCTGVTIWGVTDRWSWTGPESGALPFDTEGRAKPALEALVDPLRR